MDNIIHSIEDFSNGYELIHDIEQNHSVYNFIFLDIDMPEPDGFQLAAKISSSNDCYIIFVTSHPELVYDSLYFRPLNFITKSNDSFFTEKLHSVVNQLFNEMKQNEVIVLENKEGIRVGTDGLAERISLRTGMQYDAVQIQAIETAVQSKVLILTGGPGTGKTTTVLGIITAFREAGARILLVQDGGRRKLASRQGEHGRRVPILRWQRREGRCGDAPG